MVKFLPMLAAACALLVFVFFPKWTVDDAYITYHYADNLARHGVLTWNVGENPIEGYTGVALPALLAALIKLDARPEIASHVIGVASFFLAGAFLYVLLRRLKVSAFMNGVVMLLYVTFPFLYTNALSGLETMFFLAGITASLYIFVGCLEPSDAQKRREALLMALLLLTSLTRPEGVAFSGSLIAFLVYAKFTTQRSDLWAFVGRIGLYAIPALVYFLWRMNYYGQLLPNTFYAKTRGGISLDNVKGLNAFLFVFFSAPFAAAAIALAVDTDAIWKDVQSGRIGDAKRLRLAFFAVLTFMVLVVAQQAGASLKMNFSYRFFVPFVPILLMIIGIALDLGLRRLRETCPSHPLRYRFVVILLIALAGYHLAQVAHRLKDEVVYAREYQMGLEGMHIPAGNFLRETVSPQEWLMVLYDAGALPYYSRLKSVDMGGLNDEQIARKRVSTPQERVDYFFSKHPGVAVFSSYNADRVVHDPVAETIVNDPRFEEYTLAKTYVSPPGSWKNFFLFVYLRKNLSTPKP